MLRVAEHRSQIAACRFVLCAEASVELSQSDVASIVTLGADASLLDQGLGGDLSHVDVMKGTHRVEGRCRPCRAMYILLLTLSTPKHRVIFGELEV